MNKAKYSKSASIVNTHKPSAGEYRAMALKAHNPLQDKMKRILNGMHIEYTQEAIIGNYRVDFLIVNKKICVEVDGRIHDKQRAYDQRRDAWLASQGYKVIRFPHSAVFKARPIVEAQLASLLHS